MWASNNGLASTPLWVALVSSSSRETLRGTTSPEDRALIDKDELRVFSTLVDNFSLDTRQRHGWGRTGMAAAIRFLARREGMSRAEFDGQLAAHGDAMAGRFRETGAVGYVQDSVIGTPPEN